jgi:hypothetical protein
VAVAATRRKRRRVVVVVVEGGGGMLLRCDVLEGREGGKACEFRSVSVARAG